MPAVSLPCKPFIKPPTIPFDRLSFICQSSPLAPSNNFPILSVLPPPKKLVPKKPRLNLYRNTLISYWHQEFSKKYAAKKTCCPGASYHEAYSCPQKVTGHIEYLHSSTVAATISIIFWGLKDIISNSNPSQYHNI